MNAPTLPAPEGATPAMAQWFAAKRAHPDALVFFRMGDFFELFFDDAHTAADVLGLAVLAPRRARRAAGADGGRAGARAWNPTSPG